MPVKVNEEQQLFLLEVVVESVTIKKTVDECCIEEKEPPWTVSFWLTNTFKFELQQEDDTKTEEITCGQTKEQMVNFHSGKSCLLSDNPTKFLSLISKNPIYVSVLSQPIDSVTPTMLGHGKIPFETDMIEEFTEQLIQKENNAESSSKGCYQLYDCSKKEVGFIRLFIRLSCYGKVILSEFKLLDGMDNVLFKVEKEEEKSTCQKCGKKRITDSESSATIQESETSSENNIYSDCWKKIYSCSSKELPVSSKTSHCHEFAFVSKNSSCISLSSSECEGLKRIEAHVDLEDFIKQLCNKPSKEITIKSEVKRRFSRTCKTSDKISYTAADFKKPKLPRVESIDFREIIGSDFQIPPKRECSDTYITPILDYDRHQSNDNTRDNEKDRFTTKSHFDTRTYEYTDKQSELERTTSRPPKLRAGPRRRNKYIGLDDTNYKPGVKLGHKDCVTPFTQVPKNQGWLWPEKTDKRRGWKPGAISPTIAKILDHAKAGTTRGGGDFTSITPNKTDDDSASKSQNSGLRFTMRGGSYSIWMNPPGKTGNGAKKDSQGLFLRVNKRNTDDAYSSSSDLDFVFVPPKTKRKHDKQKIVQKPCTAPYSVENIPPSVISMPRTPQSTKPMRPESQMSSISRGSKGKLKTEQKEEEKGGKGKGKKEQKDAEKNTESIPSGKKDKSGKTAKKESEGNKADKNTEQSKTEEGKTPKKNKSKSKK